MNLVINGVVRETPELRTVDHADAALKVGDKLELVRLVGGG